ncbi:hypothetical protein [Pandoraea cepalis]|uniref:hypothetical protein n=1 Tax=Pandoraea cepalis TaxID=2508294 RepID=UPI0020C4CB24|nr:hypothetical protein [Pandoraea cepalis]
MNDPSIVATREMQRIGPVDQLEDSLQLVIAVRPASHDVQEQVQLGRSRAVTQDFVHGDAKRWLTSVDAAMSQRRCLETGTSPRNSIPLLKARVALDVRWTGRRQA